MDRDRRRGLRDGGMTGAPAGILPITAIVLTYNEEKNLPKCLDSIAGRVSEILVVDSFSTDSTVDIASRYPVKVVRHEYGGHPQQWHWTLTNAPISNDWVFAIDADFVVTEGVWAELARQLGDPAVHGFYVRHREVFRGRRISFGGAYPNHWLRIFRKSRVRLDLEERVDVHFFVDGRVESIEHDVEEQNYKDDSIFFWIQKQNSFARKHAAEELDRKNHGVASPAPARFFGTPDERKLFLKRIWYRMPLYVRPFIYFFYRYFLRLGFLDGRQGFVYHFTQGFLYRLLVDINIEEIRRSRAG
jgi:glycosyltransferase involved in cell wall biosynthesis